MGDCEFLKIGDKVYSKGRLGTITELRPDGVMVDLGAKHVFIFCTDLAKRKFRDVIERTTPLGEKYYEYPLTQQSIDREVALLSSIGFKVVVFKEEVKKGAKIR